MNCHCPRVVLWRNRGFPFTKRENWKHRAKSCTERLRRPESEVPSVKLSGSERSYCHQRGLLRWLRLACHACCSSHYWLWNCFCGASISKLPNNLRWIIHMQASNWYQMNSFSSLNHMPRTIPTYQFKNWIHLRSFGTVSPPLTQKSLTGFPLPRFLAYVRASGGFLC